MVRPNDLSINGLAILVEAEKDLSPFEKAFVLSEVVVLESDPFDLLPTISFCYFLKGLKVDFVLNVYNYILLFTSK